MKWTWDLEAWAICFKSCLYFLHTKVSFHLWTTNILKKFVSFRLPIVIGKLLCHSEEAVNDCCEWECTTFAKVTFSFITACQRSCWEVMSVIILVGEGGESTEHSASALLRLHTGPQSMPYFSIDPPPPTHTHANLFTMMRAVCIRLECLLVFYLIKSLSNWFLLHPVSD